MDNSSILLLVLLDLFLRNKFLSILQFIGNPLHDSLGRVYSSIPILHTSLFYLSEPDLLIDFLDVTEIAEIQILD